MTEHLSGQTIELYRRRQIDAAERHRTDAHLAVCEDCLKRVLNAEHSILAVNSLTEAFLPTIGEEPFHLSDAELTGHLTGSLTKADQVILESHLAICAPCKGRVLVLAADQLSRAFDPDDQTPKWRFRPWRAWKLPVPVQVALAIAVVGFLVIAVALWRQGSSFSVREESASNGSRETPTASPPAERSEEATPKPADGTHPSTPSLLVSVRDNNREIRLSQAGNLTGLEGFDESTKRMVKAALAGEGLQMPRVLDDLSSPPIRLLGNSSDDNALELIGPLGKVITEERPTFRWRALSRAASYVVSIFDENFNRVARSPILSETTWTAAEPLPRGHVYSWEVTATSDGKEITAPVAPASRAEFRILEAEKLSALTKLKQQKPVSRLAVGLMYANLGLVTEAEGQFRLLAKENPDSAAVKTLLRTVQDWR
ncbi:MAG: hypothetical protein ND895_26370 [Pyrinomonadaceae bacterium]|nr:hypothetical protein [Pyrinomonadaceae bacterium]